MFKVFRLPLRIHILFALGLSVIMRALVALYSYGPQALDDYRHGLFPALQLSLGLPLDLPEYRNQPLVWIVGGFFELIQLLGGTDRLTQLQGLYFLMGLISIPGLYGLYLLLESQKRRTLLVLGLYVVALSPALTFVSTRLLGESLASSFFVLAVALFHRYLNENRRRDLISALVLLGVATIFRFQIGIIYLFFMAYLLFHKDYRGVRSGLGVGLGLLAFQILIDSLSGKLPLGTLLAYLKVNGNGAREFGVTPWYTTWLTVLGFFFFPFSVGLLNSFRRFLKTYPILIAVVGFFTFTHSLIPHKEERFLFPLVPLITMASIYLWYYTRKQWSVKFVFIPIWLLINGSIFIIGITSNSQESIVGPVAQLSAETPEQVQLIVDIEPLFGVFGLREYFIDQRHQYAEAQGVEQLERIIVERSALSPLDRRVIILKSQESYPRSLEKALQDHHWQCQSFKKFQSWSDYAIYNLSKKSNQRRMPSWRSQCQKNTVAFQAKF